MQNSTLWRDEIRTLVRVAAAVAISPIAIVRDVLQEALDQAVDQAAVEEILLQSYLFCGLPRTLNAVKAWRELSKRPAPSDDPHSSISLIEQWQASGEETSRMVYGRVYSSLRRNIRDLHPALDTWMIVDGYGKVLSRPQLDLYTRELCIFAVCAAAEQLPQLRSHIRGARNVGASSEEIRHVIDAIRDIAPQPAILVAIEELESLGTFGSFQA